MKKNVICNYEMDKYMLENGIDLKVCDVEEDDIKTMIHRRRHTTAEKKSADAKWRVRFTGKKNGRSREDYKVAKEMNEGRREYRLYNEGSYDRHGIIQNRRDIEATKDAMNDILDKDELEYYIQKYCRLIEAKDYYENLVNRLQKECDIIRWMYSTVSAKVEAEANNNNFIYRPTVDIDSYAFDALERAKADFAEVQLELEWCRKTGVAPSLLTNDHIEKTLDWYNQAQDTFDENGEPYDEDEGFDYLRYWDDDVEDMVIKKVRKG